MRPFSLCLIVICCLAAYSPAVAQSASDQRGFQKRTFPLTPKETRDFQKTSIEFDQDMLDEQEKIAKELSDIAILVREILARQDVGQNNARQITPGNAPASMHEEIALIRSYLDDIKEQTKQQTKINVMLVKLMREQVGITRALFSGNQHSSEQYNNAATTASPETTAPLSTLSDRIKVRNTTSDSTNDTPPPAPAKSGSTWIVR